MHLWQTFLSIACIVRLECPLLQAFAMGYLLAASAQLQRTRLAAPPLNCFYIDAIVRRFEGGGDSESQKPLEASGRPVVMRCLTKC